MNTRTTFSAKYSVDDGYAGGSRPHYVTIRSGEIEEDMTVEELHALYDELIQSDFEQKIMPCGENGDEFVVWAQGVMQELRDSNEP